MNKILEKGKIQLCDKFYLDTDGFNGISLIFEETRIRLKKDGTVENYLHTDKYYYPKLSLVLNKYLQLKPTEATSIEDLKDIVLRVETLVEGLRSEHSL